MHELNNLPASHSQACRYKRTYLPLSSIFWVPVTSYLAYLRHAMCFSRNIYIHLTNPLSLHMKLFRYLYLHTHTRWFLWFTGTFHRRNGFYTVQAVCAIALHLNLALTGDGAFIFSLKKNSLCMIYKRFKL